MSSYNIFGGATLAAAMGFAAVNIAACGGGEGQAPGFEFPAVQDAATSDNAKPDSVGDTNPDNINSEAAVDAEAGQEAGLDAFKPDVLPDAIPDTFVPETGLDAVAEDGYTPPDASPETSVQGSLWDCHFVGEDTWGWKYAMLTETDGASAFIPNAKGGFTGVLLFKGAVGEDQNNVKARQTQAAGGSSALGNDASAYPPWAQNGQSIMGETLTARYQVNLNPPDGVGKWTLSMQSFDLSSGLYADATQVAMTWADETSTPPNLPYAIAADTSNEIYPYFDPAFSIPVDYTNGASQFKQDGTGIEVQLANPQMTLKVTVSCKK